MRGIRFLAVNCPYSQFEQWVSRLVPSTWVPTILIDDGDGVATRAAELMALMGYTHVLCVEGGIPAWRAQGLNLYKGVKPAEAKRWANGLSTKKTSIASLPHNWPIGNRPKSLFIFSIAGPPTSIPR